MGNITIRNLDDGVIDAWKAQAKANHRSLEAELRFVLTQRVNRRLRMAERAAGAGEGDLSGYLERAPDTEPEPDDEMPG